MQPGRLPEISQKTGVCPLNTRKDAKAKSFQNCYLKLAFFTDPSLNQFPFRVSLLQNLWSASTSSRPPGVLRTMR